MCSEPSSLPLGKQHALLLLPAHCLIRVAHSQLLLQTVLHDRLKTAGDEGNRKPTESNPLLQKDNSHELHTTAVKNMELKVHEPSINLFQVIAQFVCRSESARWCVCHAGELPGVMLPNGVGDSDAGRRCAA